MRVTGFFVLIGAIALVLSACSGSSGPGVSSGDDLANGRAKFIEAGCGGCHTLAAGGSQAVGTTGPNLDDAFRGSREQGFEESTFEQIVREQIAFPGLGSVMQPDLVEGEDADDVANFVAHCAANTEAEECPE